MKIQSIFIQAVALAILALPLAAQQVSKDSLDALKNQKQSIESSAKLNEQKIELAKLENELIEKTGAAEKKAVEAQKLADENQALAGRLKDDPQNKKLSNQASKSARTAERGAKSARKAADQAEELKKDIESLKSKIAEEETKSGDLGMAGSQAAYRQASAQSQPSASTEQINSSSSPVRVTAPPIPSAAAQASDQSASAVAQKVVESTYRSYPQQPGQPTIIINNIISPGYNGVTAPPAAKPENEKSELADKKEYEDFKAWKRQNQMQSNNRMDEKQSGLSNNNLDEEQQTMERNESRSGEKMSFRQRFGEKPARNSGLWVIPMVGVHASNFKADLGEGKADGRTGWNAGLDFRIHAKRFFIQPGAHYFSSSMRITSEDSISNAPLLSGPRIHSLKVPVLLGLYLTKANKGFFKMNVKAGATGTYVLAVDKNELEQFSKDNIEEYSYGLNAGLGLEFGLITLDFSYEWGMSPLFKDNSIKNNVLRATIGLKL
ncbi:MULTISPECIES: porin family protein [Dyadobacter]|uniref:Outer membrane protein beta-barrel domain-containing protein n=1 Tax=Dyadobacter sediminis TaxID=1493691 RepID=A0A5R9K432_9BACT|nr:porin family protein [Dyadobacter sediminis]TLU88707.1 hypothetical protein FEM55_24690 [Dyadobacter sediminis]GGC14051.1 hypothetical protein GCM10011325_46220 [Dyadobacter sediminis]